VGIACGRDSYQSGGPYNCLDHCDGNTRCLWDFWNSSDHETVTRRLANPRDFGGPEENVMASSLL
jgi:hypothetical protein